LYLKNTAYTNQLRRSIRVILSNHFYGRIRLERLLYDVERDLLAIATFLSYNSCCIRI